MRPNEFDDLSRSLGLAPTRRQILRGLVLAAAGSVTSVAFPAVFRAGPWAPLPSMAATTCSGTNTVSVPCADLSTYVASCGVICADGSRLLGAGGCTTPYISYGALTTNSYSKPTKSGKQFCASATVTWVWTSNPQTRIIDYRPSDTPCCSTACQESVNATLTAVQEHEDNHVQTITGVIAGVNAEWNQRSFTACGKSSKAADAALNTAISNAQAATKADVTAEIALEPPQAPPIDCTKCSSAATGQSCCGGNCVTSTCQSGQIFNINTCQCECPSDGIPCGYACCGVDIHGFGGCAYTSSGQPCCLYHNSAGQTYCNPM